MGWKRKFKAPTDYCFGIKHPQIQTKNPKYIRYLCVDTQRELHQWVTGIRVAKNGRALYSNYRALVDEITHADLDILVGKRGSVNSAMCLGGGGGRSKAESCATNLNFHTAVAVAPLATTTTTNSPVMTPLSENNKSFDSVLSSGIRSEHFMDNLPASTLDLVRYEMRLSDLAGNNSGVSHHPPFSPFIASFCGGGGGCGAAGGTILRRASSKSSSSLSDKSSGFEQGFESDHPAAGGTIKKRPTLGGFGNAGGGGDATHRTWDGGPNSRQGSREPSPFAGGSIRLGDGGTLLRRTASAERLLAAGGPGTRNYEELQQLLDELHSNVRQAKDIQTKIKNSLGGGGGSDGGEFPPPPPPRTSSRLSIDEDLLPPPPPELQTPSALTENSCNGQLKGLARTVGGLTIGRQLPPIAPKPSLGRLASSPSMSMGGSARSKVPTSYGTLPNPSKKKSANGGNSSNGHANSRQQQDLKLHKSGRRISFDDNIQMIDDEDYEEARRRAAANHHNHLHHHQLQQQHQQQQQQQQQHHHRHISPQLPAAFIQGLEKERMMFW